MGEWPEASSSWINLQGGVDECLKRDTSQEGLLDSAHGRHLDPTPLTHHRPESSHLDWSVKDDDVRVPTGSGSVPKGGVGLPCSAAL